MDIQNILQAVQNGISEKTAERKFELVKPETPFDKFPAASKDENGYCLAYKSDFGSFRIRFADNKAIFGVAAPAGEGEEVKFSDVSASFFEVGTADEKDLKYLVNEINDSIEENFKYNKTIKNISDIKLPPTVSKSAAKNGSSYYDPATLASRYTVMFPELREEYKRNIDTYGEFLPDEFFNEYAYAAIDVIKSNDKTQMKKLFNIFNDIYLDGTNETQSIIVVTILSKLNNDTELLASCVDYMDPELASAVINVNKYLSTRSGKKAQFLLDNPPRYKPPKQRKRILPQV